MSDLIPYPDYLQSRRELEGIHGPILQDIVRRRADTYTFTINQQGRPNLWANTSSPGFQNEKVQIVFTNGDLEFVSWNEDRFDIDKRWIINLAIAAKIEELKARYKK